MLVGHGVAVGYGVAVGHGVLVGHGVAVGFCVAAGRGVFVGPGVAVGNGVFVGRGVAVGNGAVVEVGAVKAAATFASTVASIAVSASRVLRRPASTVAGMSGVGEDAVCVSEGDGASLEQATAARLNITKTIRMAVLIIILQCIGKFQSSPSPGSVATGAHEDELVGRRSGPTRQPQFPSPHPVPSLPSAEGSKNKGPASAMPAVKSHAATLGLGTGLRCRNPRGQRQLRPLLALLQEASGLRLRRRPGVAPGRAGTKGVGTAPAISWALAHRYTPPAAWRPASHPLPAVPAQWPLTRSSSPAQDSVPRSRPR